MARRSRIVSTLGIRQADKLAHRPRPAQAIFGSAAAAGMAPATDRYYAGPNLSDTCGGLSMLAALCWQLFPTRVSDTREMYCFFEGKQP
jgi:hypothetical protein